jgi:hypothetical protein
MSENIPSPEPKKELPESTSEDHPYRETAPGKGACAAIGVALMVGTIVMGFLVPPLAVIALILAFLSLFFKGYRYIFVGFLLSALIVVGLAFLALIIICGNGQHSM